MIVTSKHNKPSHAIMAVCTDHAVHCSSCSSHEQRRLGQKLGLAYSAKLYAIAFLIVTFGRFALFAVCGLSVHMLA